MFARAHRFQGLGLDQWNVPATVASTWAMFADTPALTDVNLGGWDVSGVTDFSVMFSNSVHFLGRGLANWRVGSATTMSSMFQLAAALDEDLSGWVIPDGCDVRDMFDHRMKLSRPALLPPPPGWRPSPTQSDSE